MREAYGAMLEAVTGEKPHVLLRPANAFDRDPDSLDAPAGRADSR